MVLYQGNPYNPSNPVHAHQESYKLDRTPAAWLARNYWRAQTMTRMCSLVIEGDPTGYSAYVPEPPTILVTGRSFEELTAHAAEAIAFVGKTCEPIIALIIRITGDKATYHS